MIWNPTGEEDLEFGRIVDPESWRLLQLVAPKKDGSVSEIEMLRPLWWLEAQYNLQQEEKELEEHPEKPFDEQKLVAEAIYIQVPECGIEGWAKVLGIGKCPQISPRPGPEFQLVTATFKHHAKQILDVHIAGESNAIGTTPNHPFWSVDKQKFIRADELTRGEHVRKADGSFTTITQITPRVGANTVYNIEVHLDHTYHVGSSGVLVHNSGPCTTIHTISGSRPGITGARNSIHEQIRHDGSRSVTYFDDLGRRFSREDYGQLRPHGNAILGSDGRALPHEHQWLFGPNGPNGQQYRLLDINGLPTTGWW